MWNYRIIFNGETYWIGEVYYDHDGRMEAFTDGRVLDDWDRLEDLMTTVTLVAEALKRPVVRVDADDRILGEVGLLK